MLGDGWKQRLQLHRQPDVPADLKAARHGNCRAAQLTVQDLDAILAGHGEGDMRIGVGSFFYSADPVLDPEEILPALRPAEIKLIDRIEVFRSLPVELGW